MAPALGPSHRFIVKGDIVNDLLKGIGNVVNPKRVFRELTDFKPGEFVLIAVIIVRTLVWGDPTSGWPSMVCIIFLCSGVQLFCMGVLGQYLAKTYMEVKHRPIYIVRETEQSEA